MRILYDATPLLLRSAGVKNYHHSLLRALGEVIEPHRVTLFPFLKGAPPNRNERSNYSTVATALRLGAVLASNYLGLPAPQWAARRADLFHATHHLWRYPRGLPVTTMVHDPTPLTMPECHTAGNIRYFKVFVEKLLPRVSRLLTPSEAVKRDLTAYCGDDPDRITPVHHGVDEDFFEPPERTRQAARQAYDLPERYVLFVGSLEPRKNLRTLVEAHARLPLSIQDRFPLLIAGATGWKNADIRRALHRGRRVRVLGYVPRELLPAVYGQASLFAFPSLYEGFGLPLLEAMAAGTPVVTSNVSAMPEVLGGCGWLVDPLDAGALTEALRAALEDRRLAAQIAAQARRRARLFTWRRCAEQTKRFFEAAAG